ncbi:MULTISPECIES: dCTP deaminase domain-containing protein [unclassified Bradyrhizobium]|uniref:dCTP deaminase n=1 Tax=unclassified Bradyrhizobium TaxID=2631580 RepID=UPI002916060D|nr:MULTISPECIES: hypothetical protein [unclassified Bradyrhizobium]
MGLIVDRQLKLLIAPSPPAGPDHPPSPPLASATSAEIGKWNSKIQPASFDLTIGRILLPIDDENDEGVHEEASLSLEQGETAVVETHEYLTLPRTLAAIGFPPATVSRGGLLMTNPGHIDPGFKGRLKFTVINLGKKPVQLVSGSPICTLLFFSIEAPDFAYDQLDKKDKPNTPTERALLATLSKDFLSFGKRIQQAAASEVRQAQIWTPIIAGILAILLTIGANLFATYVSGVNELKVTVEGLKKEIGVKDLSSRIEKLEQKK